MDFTDDENPKMARLLAAAGGGALLLGLVTFVAHAIEQQWLSPELRFAGAALLSALLTLAAWPVARRGHEPVAGAIGGAGLGAWFAAWLVARHAHELVSGPSTFLALGLGAAACLLIADRLRLRLMAVLATVAACATPVLVALGTGRLVELMIYQLAVVLVLMVVDARRRWPELPTLALIATWMLGARWASLNLDAETSAPFMLWAAILLVASAGSGWRLLVQGAEAAETAHARGRMLLAGLVTWGAAAWAFAEAPQTLALASLGLAAWHLVLAVLLHHRRRDASAEADQSEASGAEIFICLAGLQMLVAGPLLLDGAALAWWWIGMAAVAVVVPGSAFARIRTVGILLPSMAATSWALTHEQAPWALGLGLVAAGIPFLASFIERPSTSNPNPNPTLTPTQDSSPSSTLGPQAILAVFGMLAWGAVVLASGPEQDAARLVWALVPITALVARICLRPRAGGVAIGTLLLAMALTAGIAATVANFGLSPNPSEPPLALAVPLIGIAALSMGLLARFVTALDPATSGHSGERPDLTPLGLVSATATGLGLALCISAVVGDEGPAIAGVGDSLSAAFAGLGLLVAGLRLNEDSWRHLGLTAIGMACFKVVFFDLAAAAMIWRALSFVGLGVILIAGAFAYTRAQQRLVQT